MSAAALYDPFDDPIFETEVKPEAEQFARAGDRGPQLGGAGDRDHYVWRGRRYPRVTTILGIASGGSSLTTWYAKCAALRSAACLVHAGLYTPDCDDPLMAELEKYVDTEAIRVLSHDDAIRQACDWRFNMLEAERYRDHKARIGTVMHHAKYRFVLHGASVIQGDLLGFVRSIAAENHVWRGTEAMQERYAAYGKTLDHLIDDLAYHALPYVERKLAWIDLVQPEYEMVGLEAMVINTGEECAGTLDGICRIRRDRWEAAGRAWDFHGQRTAPVVEDDKSGNSLPQSTRYQLASYARASFIGLVEDQSEHTIPDVDGMLACHVLPNEPAKAKVWAGRDKIDAYYEQFCLLNAFYRGSKNLPRANQSRVYREPKKQPKGERKCPIAVGGGN